MSLLFLQTIAVYDIKIPFCPEIKIFHRGLLTERLTDEKMNIVRESQKCLKSISGPYLYCFENQVKDIYKWPFIVESATFVG